MMPHSFHFNVTGSEEPFPADADSALTKYAALFDPRPCFDCIRFQFLVAADPKQGVGAFHDKLVERIESAQGENGMAAQQISGMVDFLEALREFDAMPRSSDLPDDFVHRAWPSHHVQLGISALRILLRKYL